ncbi:MAG TPA: hypothetical protein VD994_03705 [Prosthecobacter sp.]|nr:hypothetical protein [Prosthecobacter sp.]
MVNIDQKSTSQFLVAVLFMERTIFSVLFSAGSGESGGYEMAWPSAFQVVPSKKAFSSMTVLVYPLWKMLVSGRLPQA